MQADPGKAWDVASASSVVIKATSTRLIQHMWGEHRLPPTFVEAKHPGQARNALTLSFLNPEAVLFHRNKDMTLQGLIRRKLSLPAPGNFTVVLPFCNADVNLLAKNLEWMQQLGGCKTHDCLLSFDQTTLRDSVRRVVGLATPVFRTVHQTSYGVPKGTRFPQTAAWQHAARFMSKLGHSWLWMEADAVPLKSHWMDTLQSVYDKCGKPFAGPVVQSRMHVNGTAIYPSNTPDICRRTMSHTNNAFDVEMKDEMMHLCADIGHVFFHVWGVVGGRLNPLDGEWPSFQRGSPLLHQIPKTAVVLHRCKDGSLIDRLREMKNKL